MSIKKVKLNYIGTGKNSKIFNLGVDGHNEIYYGDIEPTTNMSESLPNNKYNLYNFTYNHVINNLYKINKVNHKSVSLKYNKSSSKDTSDDYLDIYVPKSSTVDVKGFTQNNNAVYTLNNAVTDDFQTVKYNFDTNLSELTSGLSKTYLYRPVEVNSNYVPSLKLYLDNAINNSEDKEKAKRDALYSIFTPTTNLKGLSYNYIMEIPLSYKYNYYDSGNIFANALTTKNHLNYNYTLDAKSTISEADESFLNNVVVDGTRDYVEINTCGDLTYLKYYDNNSYTSKSFDGNLDKNIDKTDELKTVDFDMVKTKSFKPSYLKIESISSINRFKYVLHKSNMYSIDLNNSGINSANIDPELKKNIMQDVENNIRALAKKLCPSNSELLKVYWSGK